MLDELDKEFPDWRDYTQEELDAQYNQASLVPDNSGFKQQKIELSAAARTELDCMLDVAYGPTKAEVLDIFLAPSKGAPINIFIHGGAWKAGHKDEVSYPAPVFHNAGANYVAVNFDLVPDVMLEEQVRQCRAAIAWVYRNAETFGGDRDRIFVSGHSSGGHVTGVMTITDWEGVYGLPADLIKGAAPFSGMFDLAPVIKSWRNSYLKMDEERAFALSAIHHIPEVPIDLVLGYGTKELTEFQRQSCDFAKAWRAAGQACRLLEVPGRHHFEVGADFGNPQSPVIQAIFDQMSL
ncbi:MAG: alpha/beta hydrolase [Alphaproteobacteria bacterium]|nr:alpha/beta hydrolase [Alphaproteobacteria bacterium]